MCDRASKNRPSRHKYIFSGEQKQGYNTSYAVVTDKRKYLCTVAKPYVCLFLTKINHGCIVHVITYAHMYTLCSVFNCIVQPGGYFMTLYALCYHGNQ